MQRGWEQHYIDYDALKKMIETGNLNSVASSDFYARLAREIEKVDAFVATQTEKIRRKTNADGFSKEAAAGLTSPTLAGPSDLEMPKSCSKTRLVARTPFLKCLETIFSA